MIIFGGQGCTQGDIRLVNGADQYEGRVEVCNQNVWGTVCDDSFTRQESAVICRQLGFPSAGMCMFSYTGNNYTTQFNKVGSSVFNCKFQIIGPLESHSSYNNYG